jgi:hypothetical protein
LTYFLMFVITAVATDTRALGEAAGALAYQFVRGEQPLRDLAANEASG